MFLITAEKGIKPTLKFKFTAYLQTQPSPSAIFSTSCKSNARRGFILADTWSKCNAMVGGQCSQLFTSHSTPTPPLPHPVFAQSTNQKCFFSNPDPDVEYIFRKTRFSTDKFFLADFLFSTKNKEK